ncbi:MAG: hypothetical protein II563_03490 [Treponema sp.]|nr:hypothetical protein [Treponema sp.]
MKKMRFAVIGAAMVLAGGLALAQSSMTYTATKEVFKTDVDNYMDVNTWGGVSPEKVFAFTNFYKNTLNLGAAKTFGNFYLGGYFSGKIPNIQTSQNKTDAYTVDVSRNDGTTTIPSELQTLAAGVTFPNFINTGTTSDLNFALLFGFGNIGIKAGLYYYPGSFSAKVDYTDASIYDITYKISNDSIQPYLSFGYTTELAGKTFMANASFAFDFYTRKEEVTQGSYTNVTNSRYNRIDLYAGATYDFYKTDGMVQSVMFNAAYSGYIYPKETVIRTGIDPTTQDVSQGNVFLAPSYKLIFNPVEAVSLGLTATIPFNIGFGSQNNITNSSFNMGANANVALQYTIKPDFLVFNLGGSFSLGNLINTSSSNSSRLNRNSFFDRTSIDLSTGLAFNFTKNIVLDTSFDFMTGANMTSLANIWNTSLGLQLSIKY